MMLPPLFAMLPPLMLDVTLPPLLLLCLIYTCFRTPFSPRYAPFRCFRFSYAIFFIFCFDCDFAATYAYVTPPPAIADVLLWRFMFLMPPLMSPFFFATALAIIAAAIYFAAFDYYLPLRLLPPLRHVTPPLADTPLPLFS